MIPRDGVFQHKFVFGIFPKVIFLRPLYLMYLVRKSAQTDGGGNKIGGEWTIVKVCTQYPLNTEKVGGLVGIVIIRESH